MDVHCYQTREIWTTGVTELPHSATDGLKKVKFTLEQAMKAHRGSKIQLRNNRRYELQLFSADSGSSILKTNRN
jgi:hypothetical protein